MVDTVSDREAKKAELAAMILVSIASGKLDDAIEGILNSVDMWKEQNEQLLDLLKRTNIEHNKLVEVVTDYTKNRDSKQPMWHKCSTAVGIAEGWAAAINLFLDAGPEEFGVKAADNLKKVMDDAEGWYALMRASE